MKQNTQTDYSISLSPNDVVLMVNIITTVSRRGAFEANEMVTIGSLFERLKSYIEPKQETTPELDKNQLELEFTTK